MGPRVKKYLPLAAFPASGTRTVIEMLESIFPQFHPAQNVLDTGLNSLNPIVHPPGMLLNMGFIENVLLDKWYFYTDGYTQSTGRLGEQLDKERLTLIRAFGLPEVSVTEALHLYYGHQGMSGENLHDLFKDSPVHHYAPGPKSTDNRMLTEDVPYGLVPLASLAKMVGVATPTIDAVITIACVVSQINYRQIGRTVEKLGLAGMSVAEIKKYVNNGGNGFVNI